MNVADIQETPESVYVYFLFHLQYDIDTGDVKYRREWRKYAHFASIYLGYLCWTGIHPYNGIC